MCLTVTHEPGSKSVGLIVPCSKDLNCFRDIHEIRTAIIYKTPYQGCRVPDHGWMFVRKKWTDSLFYGDYISEGAIHAYANKQSPGVPNWGSGNYEAYAFGVIAYRDKADYSYLTKGNELCAHALYIPEADRRKRKKEETIKAIKELLKKSRLTTPMVKALHPRLVNLL